MKTLFLSLLIAFMLPFYDVKAQEEVPENLKTPTKYEIVETPIEIDKNKKLNGFRIELEASEKIVVETIEKKFKSWKVSFKEKKNILSAIGVNISAISDKKIDFFFSVESKKEKTTVSAVATLGYDLAVSSKDNLAEANNIKKILSDLSEEIRQAALNAKLAEENSKLVDLEKALKKLGSDTEAQKKAIDDYNKKIADAQAKIKQNETESEKTQEKIKEKQKLLEELKKLLKK